MRLELDEHAGPARRISDSGLKRMVSRALAVHEATAARPGANHEPELAPVAARRARRARWGRVAVAAALALGAAGAVSAAVTRAFRLAPVAEIPARRAFVERRPAPARIAGPSPLLVPSARTTAAVPEGTGPVAASSPRERPSAGDWQRANQLRAEHRWAAAAQAYGALATRGSGSEASTAAVAAAALELEHLGRPARACRLYARALASGAAANAVAEEARWGLVLCAREAGHRDDELRALRTFLAEHPGSVWRSEAAARLATLESTSRSALSDRR